MGAVQASLRSSAEEGLRDLLEGVGHRQAVLLERLDRVVHASSDDQVRIAAADVQVPGQVWGAVGGSGVGVWVRRGWPVHLGSHDVGGWILLSLLELDVGEFRHADGSHYRPSLSGVGVRGGAVEAGAQMERVVVVLARPTVLPSDLRLAVNKRVWSAVSIRVSNVQVPHGMALPVVLRQNHAPSWTPGLLPHHRLIIGGGAIGRRYERAVAV